MQVKFLPICSAAERADTSRSASGNGRLSRADQLKAVVRAWMANLDARNNAGGAAVLAPGGDRRRARVLLPDPGGGRPVSRADTVFGQDRVDQGTCAVRDGGVPRGRPGDSKCASAPGPDATGALIAMRFTIVRRKITALQALWFQPPGRGSYPRSERPGADATRPSCDVRWSSLHASLARRDRSATNDRSRRLPIFGKRS